MGSGGHQVLGSDRQGYTASEIYERKADPSKQWKITDEDWRNREKWDLYEGAINEMMKKTNTSFAPWHILESNDKHYARLKALSIVIDMCRKKIKSVK